MWAKVYCLFEIEQKFIKEQCQEANPVVDKAKAIAGTQNATKKKDLLTSLQNLIEEESEENHHSLLDKLSTKKMCLVAS